MSQQQPKRTMYQSQEKMRQQQLKRISGTSSSQSNLLTTTRGGEGAGGSVHRHAISGSVLSNAVSALLARHVPVQSAAAGRGVQLVQPTNNRMQVPAPAAAAPDMNLQSRRMLMQQQLQKMAPPHTANPLAGPRFKPLAGPPPGFPPRPQTSLGVNTRLQLQPPTSSLSVPPAVGSYNHLRSYYTHHGATDQPPRGTTAGGAVNSSTVQQQQQQQVDKGKRPLLAEQVNPYEQAAKKSRAVENSGSNKYINPITKRMMDMKSDAHRNGIRLLRKMPSVSAKGPNNSSSSRKLQGFLYSYGVQESDVRIMCNCHGALLSPSAFLKHAGGGDVADPLKHITVSVMVSAPPLSL